MPKIKSTEKATQAAILQYLSLRRVFHYRNNSGGLSVGTRFVRFGAPGSPDIVAVVGGQYVGIEVKDAKGIQTSLQKFFQQNLEDAGGMYILARSLEDVTEKLKI